VARTGDRGKPAPIARPQPLRSKRIAVDRTPARAETGACGPFPFSREFVKGENNLCSGVNVQSWPMGGGLVHGCDRRHENGAIALASTLAGLVAGIRLVPALALAALRPEAAAGVGLQRTSLVWLRAIRTTASRRCGARKGPWPAVRPTITTLLHSGRSSCDLYVAAATRDDNFSSLS
jgi:hypothetical protein